MNKAEKLKKILILFAGGTISMKKNIETGALDIAFGPDQFFQLEPRIEQIADIHVHSIDNIDSTNMTHIHWERMVEVIQNQYHNYDGFVITQGTNTLAYTSSALTWSLLGIGKPVVLTGAQIPAEVISTDARNNLVNALRVCTMDLGGIFVVFGSKIILGCRAKKVSESKLDAFNTFNDSDFGEVGVAINIKKQTHRAHSHPFMVKNGYKDTIVCLTFIPGLGIDCIKRLIDDGAKGIILRAYGSGDIPYSHLSSLLYARKKKVPIVVTTQCPGGATAMGMNDVGLKALNTGVIQAFDMSMESMSTKLMWLLAQDFPYEEIAAKMQENLAGEVDIKHSEIFLNK